MAHIQMTFSFNLKPGLDLEYPYVYFSHSKLIHHSGLGGGGVSAYSLFPCFTIALEKKSKCTDCMT